MALVYTVVDFNDFTNDSTTIKQCKIIQNLYIINNIQKKKINKLKNFFLII